MSMISKISMLAASGASAATEFVRIGEGTSGTYNYNEYVNAVLKPDTGELIVLRSYRTNGVSQNLYTEKYSPSLDFVKGDQTYQPTSGNWSRNLYGSPKWTSDPTNSYDVVSGDGATYAGNAIYGDINGGSIKQWNVGYLYSSNSFIGRVTKAYNIGDRTYLVNSTGAYGGSFSSFKHTATGGSTSLTLPANPAHYNYAGGVGASFIDILPVDPTSQSTNHIAIHSSNYSTQFYTINSSFQPTGSGWALTTGTILQYWSNMCIDSTSNTVWAYNMQAGKLYSYNYSTNTLSAYAITYPGAGSATGQSNYLALINGYLYLQVGNRSQGMFVVRIDTSNPTSGVQSKLFADTSGYGSPSNNYVQNQEGFLVEGPNAFHGTTDLMYIGFNNYTNSTGNFKRVNMAVCTWDNISKIADYNSNLSASNSSVSVTLSAASGSSTTVSTGGMYGISNINASTTGSPRFYLTSPSGVNVNNIDKL